jgi:asparagine synthase (glutamine-hydrolysing)
MIRGVVFLEPGDHQAEVYSEWVLSGSGYSFVPDCPNALMVSRKACSAGHVEPRAPQSRFRVAVDARLDKRAELLSELALQAGTGEQLPDGELLGLALDKWGESAFEHIHGEFALAAWEPETRTLLLGRDRHGVRPLYYRLLRGGVAFSSNIDDLRHLPGESPELDPVGLTMALIGMYECKESTVYKSIWRVPPGHWVRIEGESVCLQSYWQLDPEKEIRLPTDEDYAVRVRELFTDAVRRRIDVPIRVAAALSGGLDSSSICSVASRLMLEEGRSPLLAISGMLPASSEFSEEEFIQAVAALPHIEHHPFGLDGLSPTSGLERMLAALGTPLLPGNMFIPDAAYAMARQLDVGVYLDGYDGDNVIGHGRELLSQLAMRRQWLRLYREIKAHHALGGSYGHLLMTWTPRQWMARYLWKSWLRHTLPLRAYQRVRSSVGRLFRSPKPVVAPPEPLWNRELIDEYEVRRLKWKPSFKPSASPRHAQAAIIDGGQQPWLLEITAALAASHGIEVRVPFFDTDLIEFCIAIPTDQKMRNGYTRWVMRNAMKGIMPDKVRLRPHKSTYEFNFAEALRRNEMLRIKRLLLHADLGLDALVNMDRIRSLVGLLEDGKLLGSDLSALYRTFVLAVWLDSIGYR